MFEVNWWDEYGRIAVENQSSSDWIKDTELALKMLRERDPLLHDCIFTLHKSDNYLSALWGARLLLSEWLMGRMEIAVVETDSEPPTDNQLPSFSPKLPHPFEIELWGGIDDFDGVIKWAEPIPFMDWQGNFSRHEAWEGAPVEVGECHPVKMWVYLVQGGYLARYPYGWRKIVIFYLHRSVWDEIFGEILKTA
jgi:hypothetical protein